MSQDTFFWTLPEKELFEYLKSSNEGITDEEALIRLSKYGNNTISNKKRKKSIYIFLNQFKNPILVILLIIALLSIFFTDFLDMIIILIIIFISSFLGFWQEKRSTDAMEKLMALIHISSLILRDGKELIVKVEDLVPGDIVILSAGSMIPADCVLLKSNNLFVNEAMLTGETFPSNKKTDISSLDTPLNQRYNGLFMGTHVVSGTGKAIIVKTSKETEFGKISENLQLKPPQSEFEYGIKKFGFFLTQMTLILVISIFAINIFFSRSFLESLLFSLALAVGLIPQLLPAIISVSLAKGAKKLADHKVIVKKLNSIENLGSMDILCSDKTGTLTEGMIKINASIDYKNNPTDKVFLYSYYNAFFQSGYINPIDEAIKNHKEVNTSEIEKLDEIPYDFIRKRLTVLISNKQENKKIMITKGAVPYILDICTTLETSENEFLDLNENSKSIKNIFETLSNEGLRLIAVAYKEIENASNLIRTDEENMIFLGFLVLFDPLKEGIKEAIQQLNELKISLKLISGDNKLIANHIATQLGIKNPNIITGYELRHISDEALITSVNNIDIFAEIEPNQKERIILALKKNKHVVGYMGDGINDTPALHNADVSISVDSAVDIAKDAAEIILLEKNLQVLVDGVKEGRKTFANTIKYIYITTSANFGNMFSMAGASLFLPFLPMLPKQILLTNLITDIPSLAIGSDNVDEEMIDRPRRWNIKFIRNYMIIFGLASSIFDFITFSIMILLLKSTQGQFQTSWFFVSVITEILVLLVIRTRKLFFKSKPGNALIIGTIIILVFTFIIISSPLGILFGFEILPLEYYLFLWLIISSYILSTMFLKKIFYRYIEY